MGTVFSSPTDETGTAGRIVKARTMADFTTETDDYYVVDRDIGVVEVVGQLSLNKPLLITAGNKLIWYGQLNSANAVICQNTGANIITLPMLTGDITSFAVGANTTVSSTSHGLIVGDIVKIMDSRVEEYNGNFEVLATTTNTFTIEATFSTADGTCRWVQNSGAVTFSAGTGSTVLTLDTHDFDVDDWINLEDTDVDGSYQITATDTNTITITLPTTTSTSGNITTHVTNVESTRMYFLDFTGGSTSSLFDIQGDPERTTVVVERTFVVPFTFTNEIDDTRMFQLGEVRDCLLCFIGSEGACRNGGGLRGYDNERIAITDLANYTRLDNAFATQDYLPIVRTGGNTNQLVAIQSSIIERVENQSAYEFPATSGDDFRSIISFLSDASPGDVFAKGVYARCSDEATDDTTATFPIAPGEFDRYRDGDSISILETSKYDGLTGTISQVNASSIETSIFYTAPLRATATGSVTANTDGTVDIIVDDSTGFVAGDYIDIDSGDDYDGIHRLVAVPDGTSLQIVSEDFGTIVASSGIMSDQRPLILNTSMVSLDYTDPRVNAIQNVNLPNSMSVGESALTSVIAMELNVSTYTVVDGTWENNVLERFTSDDAGTLTYTGLEEADFTFTYSIEANGDTQNATFDISPIKNGLQTGISTFSYAGAQATLLYADTIIVTLDTGDTIALGLLSTSASNLDVSVQTAHFTINKGG